MRCGHAWIKVICFERIATVASATWYLVKFGASDARARGYAVACAGHFTRITQSAACKPLGFANIHCASLSRLRGLVAIYQTVDYQQHCATNGDRDSDSE
jgi:hypothetical protein